jgi:hypothetical protein
VAADYSNVTRRTFPRIDSRALHSVVWLGKSSLRWGAKKFLEWCRKENRSEVYAIRPRQRLIILLGLDSTCSCLLSSINTVADEAFCIHVHGVGLVDTNGGAIAETWITLSSLVVGEQTSSSNSHLLFLCKVVQRLYFYGMSLFEAGCNSGLQMGHVLEYKYFLRFGP